MGTEYRGLLFIGDPHLASQVPGFRKDDFPQTALGKLRHCLDYAREERLLPAILGDLFNCPRDNANWLLGDLIVLLGSQEVVGVYGNHDCRENSLLDHDSLSVLEKAEVIRLVDEEHPWRGIINDQRVVLGGSSWGQPLPKAWDQDPDAIVFWMGHHDLKVPGYAEGYQSLSELPGIHAVINGHIHRNLESVVCGSTTWITPGNICRVKRSDASKVHCPSVLRIDVDASGWTPTRIPIPYAPFDEVFHPELVAETLTGEARSSFIEGLAELEALRTAEGAGFKQFLDKNLSQFPPEVQRGIWDLWQEVNPNG